MKHRPGLMRINESARLLDDDGRINGRHAKRESNPNGKRRMEIDFGRGRRKSRPFNGHLIRTKGEITNRSRSISIGGERNPSLSSLTNNSPRSPKDSPRLIG